MSSVPILIVMVYWRALVNMFLGESGEDDDAGIFRSGGCIILF